MHRRLVLAAAALALAACHTTDITAAGNEGAANITAFDPANVNDGTNITDVPEDDGDAPGDIETNTK